MLINTLNKLNNILTMFMDKLGKYMHIHYNKKIYSFLKVLENIARALKYVCTKSKISMQLVMSYK